MAWNRTVRTNAAIPLCVFVFRSIVRVLLPAYFICAFTLVVAPAQTVHTTVRHHRVAEEDNGLSQAETAIEKKDYAAAEALLQKIVASEPKNYQAWFDLGFVYNALGRTEESIAAYRKSVDAKPDVFESNLNLGLMLARSGQPGADRFLRAATQLKPTANVDEGHYRAWLSLGNVLASETPQEAIGAFHQASLLQPKDPEPHISAGALLEKEGHYADAEQEYKQALALDPQSADALTGLANIYTRGRRFSDAEPILRKLVAAHPSDTATHLQLGRMLAADGRNDEAIIELQAVLKSAPNDAGAQRDLADLYFAAKKYDQAAPFYRALLAQSPKDAVLHNSLGQSLLHQHKFEESQQEFLTALQLKPDFGEAYGNLAAAANERKDYVHVIQALDERAKLLPEVPATYFLRATAYDHLHKPKPAAENYHRFLDAANGQYPEQEWQARHRLIAIEPGK